MKFDIPKREHPNVKNYAADDIKIAYKFAGELHKEMESFIKAVVIFGSTARHTKGRAGDIDILVIVDDLTMNLTAEVVEAYRVIVQKIITRTSTKLHIISLRFK